MKISSWKTAAAFGCAVALSADSASAAVVEYGCHDVVVIGTIKNRSYTPVSTNDILGQGRIELEVSVRKRLRGSDYRRIIPAFAVAHTYLNERNEFLLVLSPTADKKAYEIKSLDYWKIRGSLRGNPPPPRPTLSPTCS